MMTLEITQRAREIAARTTHCGATGQAIIAGRLDMDQRVQAAQLALNECAAEIKRMRKVLRTIADGNCMNPWGTAQKALDATND